MFSWVDDRSKLLRLLFLLVITGLLVSTIGIFQRFLGVEKIYGLWKPIFKTDQSFFGPYVNPNHFAGYVALIIPIAVCLLIRQIERMGWGRTEKLKVYLRRLHERDILVALFLLFSLYIMVSGLFLSLSRGGLLAFAGSMILLIIILSIGGGWRRMLGFGLMIGFFAALFVFWLGFLPFQGEVETFANLLRDLYAQKRVNIWKDVWTMLMDFPLFGTGLGTFAHIYPAYKTILGQATLLYPENDFLQILVETGLVGFGVLAWFFAAFFRTLWIQWRHRDLFVTHINPKVMAGLTAGIVALLIHGIGDFNLHIPANALQFAIVMGLSMTVMREKMDVGDR